MAEDSSARRRRPPVSLVVTRIVDYDRRVADDETHTLSLARRDAALIQALAEGFKGRVLPGGSDGVVAAFPSAEDALACAQEIQRQLAEGARGLLPREALSHRIGIHRAHSDGAHGIETVAEGDLQIALQVQSLAPPGGLCVSGPFYDLVGRRSLRIAAVGPMRPLGGQGAVQVFWVLGPGDSSDRGPTRPKPPHGVVQKAFAVIGMAGIVLVLGAGFLAVRNLRDTSSADLVPVIEAPPRSPEVPPAAIEPPPAGAIAPSPTAMPHAGARARSGSPSATSRPTEPKAAPLARAGRSAPGAVASGSALDTQGLSSDDLELFRQLDINRDGTLTRQEIPFELRSKIMWADADGDGAVTLEELKAARARQGGRRREDAAVP